MRCRIIIAGLLVGLLLAGCNNAAHMNEQMTVLQSEMDQLQSQLGILQAPEDAAAEESGQGAERSNIPEQAIPLSPSQRDGASYAKTAADYDIAALEAAVDSAVAQVDAANPSDDAQTNRALFLTLHAELEAAEEQVDQMEDAIEDDYRNGKLSRDDYMALDRRLDALEESLDRAERLLERTFGMDD